MIAIRPITIAEMLDIQAAIPELSGGYPGAEYERRFAERPFLALGAFTANGGSQELVGFKVGYQWDARTFYSWMGGVRPQDRGAGVAVALADEQEAWALVQGYECIQLKTWNKHRNMLIMSIKREYVITAVEKRTSIEEYRIHLVKQLR